jgi:hypothetical protein
MVTISNCKNMTFAPGSRQRNKTGNQAKAFVFASTPECENVQVFEPYIESHHATEDLAVNRAELYVYGINCKVVRPRINLLGAARQGIRMGGTSASVVDPEISGCAQAIITDAPTGAKVYDYNPAKITRANTTGAVIQLSSSTDVLTEVLSGPPRANAWDRGLIGSPSGRLIVLSSGHKPTLVGAFSLIAGRWNCLSASATLPRYAAFDIGSIDAQVESYLWLGARDSGGSGTFSVGHCLRYVAEDVNLMVELRDDRLSITYRAAGGLTLVSLASVTGLTHTIGRRYHFRSVVFGASVEAYLDGVKIASATLDAGQLTALSTGTKHGITTRQSLASQWDAASFRVNALT